jgi:hypothetical protein
MSRIITRRRRLFVRDALASTVLIVGLYGLAKTTQIQVLQIPGYLIIAGFDMLEMLFGSSGSLYELLIATYLIGLGILGAIISTGLRALSGGAALPSWRAGVSGALAILGALSLLFGLSLVFGSSQLSPGLTSVAAGLVLLVLAALVSGEIVFGENQ